MMVVTPKKAFDDTEEGKKCIKYYNKIKMLSCIAILIVPSLILFTKYNHIIKGLIIFPSMIIFIKHITHLQKIFYILFAILYYLIIFLLILKYKLIFNENIYSAFVGISGILLTQLCQKNINYSGCGITFASTEYVVSVNLTCQSISNIAQFLILISLILSSIQH